MKIKTLLRRLPFSVRFFAGILAVVVAGVTLVTGLTIIGYEKSRALKQTIEWDLDILASLSDASKELGGAYFLVHRVLMDAGKEYDEETVYTRGSAAIAAIDRTIGTLQSTFKADAARPPDLRSSLDDNSKENFLRLVTTYRHAIISTIEMTSVDLELAQTKLTHAADAFGKASAAISAAIVQFEEAIDLRMDDSTEEMARTLMWWGFPVSLIVIVVLLISWLTTKQLAGDLGQILAGMRRLGTGNTGIDIPDLWGDPDLAPIADALGVFRAAIIDLRNSRDILEDKVRERTLELEKAVADLEREMGQRAEAESRLRQAQKMQSLGNLAGGLAHEINNLLLPILALAQMTRKQLPEGSRDALRLQKIIEASERAKDLVAQVMAFGRQEEPKMELVNLHRIVRETMEVLYKTLLSTITVRQSLDETTGTVWADAAQISAIVMNLVTNAQDSFEGEKGEVDISLGPIAVDAGLAYKVDGLQAGPYAKLTISDRGRGMDDDTLKRAFDPFFTTKEVGKGKGLGLSMVYGIVNKHGGAVNLASKPGAGTIVDVYLPLIQQKTA